MYKRRSKAKFEFELSRIKRDNGHCLNGWNDITDDLAAHPEYGRIKEFVYEYATRNRVLFLRIFSSIDVETQETRDCGSDAVRVVCRWRTKNGDIFAKTGGKLTRQENLFAHLENRLVHIAEDRSDLSARGPWQKDLWEITNS